MKQHDVQITLQKLAGLRIGVIGDLMLDGYITGHAGRISPEAPVPVVKVSSKRSVLGGAANVLRNLVALGAQGVAFGIVGVDAAGRELIELCKASGIDTQGIVEERHRPTTVKTRVIADQQQVVRIDEEDDGTISEATRLELLERLALMVRRGDLDAIIIEDYDKGVIDQELADRVMALAGEATILTALDPHPGNPVSIPGLTIMTPNRSEAFALTGVYHRPTVLPLSDDEPLQQVGRKLMNEWRPEMLLITLGGEGMALFTPGEPPRHMPTVAREVFDVSGAGDTVIATFTAGRLAGLEPAEAVELANHAAGVVVGKVGTVPVDTQQLIASFEE